MPRTCDKRERLIDAASDLIRQQGFHSTTLADIADASEVPLGNVYYYFKTKEELCEAVIEQRRQFLVQMFKQCDCDCEPKETLKKFVRFLSKESKEIAENGCSVGSLCQELDKTPSTLTDSADNCMRLFIEWTSKQFKELGYKNADKLGFELMARIQGTMLLGHALRDPKHIRSQLQSINEWIDSL